MDSVWVKAPSQAHVQPDDARYYAEGMPGMQSSAPNGYLQSAVELDTMSASLGPF